MFKVAFQLEGFDELVAVLRALPDAMQGAAADSAVRAGANVVAKEMRRRAPVRADARLIRLSRLSRKFRGPGNLRRSIRVRKVPARQHNYASQYVAGTFGQGYYGLFHEFGTATLPARPFLRPAVDAVHAEAIRAMGTALGKAAEREAELLAGRYSRRLRKRLGVRL